MSQSKPNYGTVSPKDYGNKRCHRHPQAQTEDEAQTEIRLEPACRSRHVEDWQWREIPYDERLRGPYRLCEWPECFGGDDPDPADDDLQTVIRSQRAPTVLHRPYKQSHPHEATPETSDDTSIKPDPEPITTIADLRLGDGVIWDTVDTPKVVAEYDADSDELTLRGPAGGKYLLRERYDSALVIYPGHGEVSPSRIATRSSHQSEKV